MFAYSGDRAVTDDAIAEAFAQALRRGDAIVAPERWLWRAAFRIAAGLLQDRRRWIQIDRAGLVQSPSSNPEVSGLELRELTDQQRACLSLHYYAGYPTAEISNILGISPAAVRMRMTRGRRALRKAIERGLSDD